MLPTNLVKYFLFSLLIVSLNTNAAPRYASPLDYFMQFAGDQCQNNDGMSNVEHGMCMYEAKAASIRHLESAFRTLLNKVKHEKLPFHDSEQHRKEWIQTLKQTQAYWEKYRNMDCDKLTMMGANRGASGGENMAMGCHIEHNFQRIQDLKRYL